MFYEMDTFPTVDDTAFHEALIMITFIIEENRLESG